MGEAGVGKSCIIKRYCEEQFVTRYISTIGVDYGVKSVQVDGVEAKVNFWKTQLWAATAKDVESGKFYVPVGKPVDNAVFHDAEQVDGLGKYTEEELAKHGASGWPSA